MPEQTETSFPLRLRLGRHFRGWTQAELATEIDATRQFVHQLEGGTRAPNDLMRKALAEALEFQVEYFDRPVTIELRDEECHFRKRATTPLHVRNRVMAHGTLLSELVQWLDSHLRLPPLDLPEHNADALEEIERSSEACREHWQLKVDAPIQNMTRVLERAGVVVASFSGISTKVDAFSWHGRRPLVIRSTDKCSTSRARWDLAHECGHLVLHAGIVTGEAEREAEADRFAGAFLLPRRGFVREFPRGPRLDWAALFRLKERWGVSVQAIVRRAYELRLLTAIQYRRAQIHISKRGWRTGEPQEPAEESAELVATALSVALDKLGKGPRAIAQELGWGRAAFEAVAGVRLPKADVIPIRNPTA